MKDLIAFMTDWGYESYYVGVAKAVVKSINPDVEIIDITHGIEPFNVRMAMHMLERVVPDFPRGTVFLVVVDQGVGTSRKAIAFKTKDEDYFVGPDNGVFTLVLERFGVEEIRELKNPYYFYKRSPSHTFHGRDIFAPAAAHISKGVPISEFGPRLFGYTTLPVKKAKVIDGKIRGEIAYFDGFGNIETNIPAKMLQEIGKDLDDIITVSVGKRTWKAPLVRAFGEVKIGELLIHEDSSGYLEIAVNQGSAKDIMKVDQGVEVFLY